MPQMKHCQRCRADACGLLAEGTTQETLKMIEKAANAPINPDEERPYVAVATREGVLVNEHLGEAEELSIFGETDGTFQVLETRKTPDAGGGSERWIELATSLKDCRALLVSGIGPKPNAFMRQTGLKVIVMEGLIEETLRRIYAGEEVRSPIRGTKCGEKCSGSGAGCG
jgi:nitrogen fixation protein NifB